LPNFVVLAYFVVNFVHTTTDSMRISDSTKEK